MMKSVRKVLAVLAIVGMLVGVTGTVMAKSEPIPWIHSKVWKANNSDMEELVDYVSKHGYVNIFALIFGRTLVQTTYFVSADIYMTVLVFPDRRAFLFMDVPYRDGYTLRLVEEMGDGDLLVDAVLVVNDETGMKEAILYARGESVPSIYSSIYKKCLSKVIHNEVYDYGMEEEE